MTKVMEFAAERDFLDKIDGELAHARQFRNWDLITEAVEDLEMVVQHTESDVLRGRAQRLILKAFDPLGDPRSGAAV